MTNWVENKNGVDNVLVEHVVNFENSWDKLIKNFNKKIMKTLLFNAFFLVSFYHFSQSFVNDQTFTSSLDSGSTVYDTEIQTDGKIVVGGSCNPCSGVFAPKIARLLSDGAQDPTFNVGLGFNSLVKALAIQPNGKILVTGSFTAYNGIPINDYLARLNSDGTIDNTFNSQLGNYIQQNLGWGPNPGSFETIDLQADGKILVGSNQGQGLFRLNMDGTIDNGFNQGGVNGNNGIINKILIQPDGKIVIGGAFSSPSNYICRLNPNGIVDATFTVGTGFNDQVLDMILQPDGKIVIGGSFTYYNGINQNCITRLNSNGAVDNNFNIGTGIDYVGGSTQVNRLALRSNGNIIVEAYAATFNGNYTNSNPFCLNSDGTLNSSFNVPGITSLYNYHINKILIPTNGKILLSGGITYIDTVPRNGIIRLIECTTPPVYQTIDSTFCGSYTTQLGQVITQSGTLQENILNVIGCDSLIITYNLTLAGDDFNGTTPQLTPTNCIPGSSGSATILFNPILVAEGFFIPGFPGYYGGPLISEYYSGSGQIQAIEIYNTDGGSIDLGGYNLVNSSNQEYYIPQNTIVPAHGTLVIAHPNSGLAGNLFTSVVNGTPIILRFISQSPIDTSNYDYAIPITNQTIIRKHTINLSSSEYLYSGNYTPSEWLTAGLTPNTLGSHYNPSPFYSVVWDNGFTGNTQTNLSQGDYAYSIVHSASGCVVQQDTISIAAIQNDNISITPNPAFGNAPLNVAFANQTQNLSNYNFTWYFGDGTSQQSNAPFLSHTYTQNGYADVTVVADDLTTGCSSSQTFNDMIFVIGGVTCTHTATINQSGPLTGCVGDSILLSSNTDPSFTYQWNKNGIPVSGATSSSFYPTQSGSYTVTIYQNNCPVTSAGISVTMNALPTVPNITSSGTIVPCSGGSMTLTAPSGLTSYLWNTGSTASSLVVSQSGNYSVTVTNSNGCLQTSNPFAVNASFMAAPQVCIVGVDSLTNENRVVWEKPLTLGIDSFYVYKETNVSNIYTKIGATDYNQLAVFLDVNSNPAVQAYRYKISAKDTCGVETNVGDFHKTIHLTINQGIGGAWNLIWSHYEGLNFGSYNIYRGTDPSNISLLTTIQSNLNSYTDLAPPTGPLYYQIEVVNPVNCDPTKIVNYGVSRSNIVNNGVSGVIEISNTNILVYPNPTNGNITLEVSSELVGKRYSIRDFSGRIIRDGKISSTQEQIDLQNVARGAYYLSIENSTSVTKLIKQ